MVFAFATRSIAAFALLVIACSNVGANSGGAPRSPAQPATPPAAAPSLATPGPSVAPSAYRVEWSQHRVPAELARGQEQRVAVTLRNAGDQAWPVEAIFVSYHWFTAEAASRMVDKYDGVRTPLPRAVAPGETVSIPEVRVLTPPAAGAYLLQITLVHEGVTWFENAGAATLKIPVTVV